MCLPILFFDILSKAIADLSFYFTPHTEVGIWDAASLILFKQHVFIVAQYCMILLFILVVYP